MSGLDALYNLTGTTPVMLKPCLAQKNWVMIGFMPLDIIAISINLALLAASLVNKEKLQRQNYTIATVNSALLSHTVYLALKIWGASDSTLATDSDLVVGMPKILWTVCAAGLSSIEFGVVANASSVIYVTLDSTIVATRSRLNSATTTTKRNSKLPFKKNIAILLMAVSWIVPVTFIIIATAAWNCAKDCWCPSSFYKGPVCPHENRCSRLMPPLPTSFLLLNAGLWALEIVGLIGIIIKKSLEFRDASLLSEESGLPAADESSSCPMTTVTEGNDKKIKHATKTSRAPAPKKAWKATVKFNTRFRMAIFLTILLITCFVPFGLTILIDAVKPDANLMPAAVISMTCLYLYMLIFPFLVMKYLPSLRESLGLLVGKICCPC